MPRQIVFTIPGNPRGKGRAKSSSRIGKNPKTGKPQVFTRHYTPEETAAYESLVRLAAQKSMNGQAPFRGALRLDFEAIFGVPPSWSSVRQRRALAGEIVPSVKPDKDNIEKALCDGMNSVVYLDDARIVEGFQRKRYGTCPGLTVVVTELDAELAQGRGK